MFIDFNLQRNMFGTGRNQGWHVDSGSEGRASYLYNSDYRFLKSGIYLQDNSDEWGGGITVVPKGHKFPLKTFLFKNFDWRLKEWKNKKGIEQNSLNVPIEAGDFIAFDSRLPHTSTYPKKRQNAEMIGDSCYNMPEDKYKYVIYWNTTNRKSYSDLFLENSKSRAVREELNISSANEIFYTDYLRYHYPTSYNPRFVELVKVSKINIATLTQNECNKWESNFLGLVNSNSNTFMEKLT